jgi:OOP family OmpA-OmpF porin
VPVTPTLKGTDAYNQKLSERRAKAVYDYLTSNGVESASRLVRARWATARAVRLLRTPMLMVRTTRKVARKNRRTELNVQN